MNHTKISLPAMDQSTFQTLILNHIIKIEAALSILTKAAEELKNSTTGANMMMDTTTSDREQMEQSIRQVILEEIGTVFCTTPSH